MTAIAPRAIAAAHGDLRSRPRAVGGGEITLTLTAARRHEGRLTWDGARPGVLTAFARYRIGQAGEWMLQAPVGDDGGFVLAGVPDGPVELGVAGVTARGERRTFVTDERELGAMQWPRTGIELDVIVRPARGASLELAEVFVASGTRRATSIADLRRAVRTLPDLGVAQATPIQARFVTAAGANEYRAGDLDAVFDDVARGPLTVCVVPRPGELQYEELEALPSTTPIRCQTIAIDATPSQAVVIDLAAR